MPDDKRFNGTFTVPRGIRLEFCTLHGQANTTNPTEVLKKRPDELATAFNVKSFGMKGIYSPAPAGKKEGDSYVFEETDATGRTIARKGEIVREAGSLQRRALVPEMQNEASRDAKGRKIGIETYKKPGTQGQERRRGDRRTD